MLGALRPIEPADDSRYARLLECADRLSHPSMRAAGHPKSGVGWQQKPRQPRGRVSSSGVGGQSCSSEPVSITGSQQGFTKCIELTIQSVDQRMRLECGVGFRQLRTCRRIRPGQLSATSSALMCRWRRYLRCVDVMPAYYAAVSERRRFLRV